MVASGVYHTVALKNDGTVVAWGYNGSGQTNVPATATGVTQVAAGGRHNVAIRSIIDCNNNSLDDPYELTLATTWNLNSDSIPDVCQGGTAYEQTSPDLGTPRANILVSHTFGNFLPTPAADPKLIIRAQGDLAATNKFITVRLNGKTYTRVFETDGKSCADGVSEATITLPRSSWASLTASGSLVVGLLPSPALQTGCTGSMAARLRYLSGDDCDTNNVMDGFQIAAGADDSNTNGRLDTCEWRKGDLDLNSMIDFGDVAILMLYFGEPNPLFGDLDGNLRIDFGDIALLLLDFGPVQWP
jgi:hypothetical protein